MANNPITSKDFYKDEGDLKLLLEQMKSIQTVIDGVVKQATALNSVISKLNPNKGGDQAKIIAAATQMERLHQAQLRTSKLQEELRGKVARAEAAIAAQGKASTKAAIENERLAQAQNRTAISAERLAQAQRRSQQQAERSRSSFMGLMQSVRNLGYTYFSLAAAQRVVGVFLDQTKELSSLNLAYNTVTGSVEKTAEAQEFVLGISDRLGSSLLTTSREYLKFSTAARQAGLSQAETNRIFKTFTKTASFLGLGGERLGYIFLALEQIMSKGRLSTEELRRQLGEHLPGAFGIAADAIGVTTAELTEMLRKGEVISSDFLPKFATQVEKAYKLENVERVDNLAAAQGRFNNEITRLIDEIDLEGFFKDFFDTMADGIRYVRENAEAFIALGKAILYVVAAWVSWKIGAAVTGLASLTRGVQALGAALKANPIGAVLVAVTALVGLMDALTKKINAASESQKSLNRAKQSGIDNARIEEIQIGNLIEAYGREYTSNEQKLKILQKLEDMGVTLVDLDGDKVISINEVKAATDAYIKSLRNQFEVESLVADLRNAQQARQDLQDKNIPPDVLINRFAPLLGLSDKLLGTTFTNEGRQAALGELDKQIAFYEDELRKRYEATFDPFNDTTRTTVGGGGDDPGGKDKSLLDEFARRRELAALIEDDQARELALLQIWLDEKLLLFERNGLETNALYDKFNRDRLEITRKYAEGERSDLEKKGHEIAEAFMNMYRGLWAGDAKEREEFQKNREREKDLLIAEFEARQDHADRLFDLDEHTEEERFQNAVKREIEKLEFFIGLHRTYGDVLTDEQLERDYDYLNELKALLGDTKPGGGRGGDFLLDALGISEERQDAVKEAWDFAKFQLQSYFDLQSQLREAELEEAQRNLEAKQRIFDEELRLAELGYANNVDQARKELALAKNQQQQALKENQKYQKAQLAINTALEASHLIVGLAKITAELGPLAPIAWAVVLGAFAAAKIKAFQLASKRVFRKGGFEEITTGGSHESGNDTFVGHTKTGPGYAEKGESIGVFTKKATGKYKSTIKQLVDAANKGRLEQVIGYERNAARDIPVLLNNPTISTRALERKMDALIAQGEKQTFVAPDGSLIKYDRGRKSVIRKR